jgi:NTE family protein
MDTRIGLAFGGGFARGVAHVGVLDAFRRHGIPIHCVTGVSAGAIVAAAYASGTSLEAIAQIGCAMRFGDVGRLRPGRLGFVSSHRMEQFLARLLKGTRFDEMNMPLGVVATDLSTGEPVCFSKSGDVVTPLRASCAFPGLFKPVRHEGRLLVDGAIGTTVPAALARQLGATHVVGVTVSPRTASEPANVFEVVGRCFQILQGRSDEARRHDSDLLIVPEVGGVEWNAFNRGLDLIAAGDAAALAALPTIRQWCLPISRVPAQMVA